MTCWALPCSGGRATDDACEQTAGPQDRRKGSAMYGYDHGMNGWGYAVMTLGMLAFWTLVAIAFLALLRRPAGGPRRHQERSPRQLLAERFARGEIDDEYHRRLSVLEYRPPGDHRPPKKT
jgi:putative membrane protein